MHILDIHTRSSLLMLNVEAANLSVMLVPIKVRGITIQKTVIFNKSEVLENKVLKEIDLRDEIN